MLDTKIVKPTARKPPAAGKGRPKGALNKTTQLLKDAILQAATDAGDGDMAAYLEKQARETPSAFLALLGKVLPMQIAGDADNPLKLVARIERVIVDPANPNS